MPHLSPGSQTSLGRPMASWDLWGWCWWLVLFLFCNYSSGVPRPSRERDAIAVSGAAESQTAWFQCGRVESVGFSKNTVVINVIPLFSPFLGGVSLLFFRSVLPSSIKFFHSVLPFVSFRNLKKTNRIKTCRRTFWSCPGELEAVCLPAAILRNWEVKYFHGFKGVLVSSVCFVFQVIQEKKEAPGALLCHHGVRGVGMWLKF